MDDMDTKPLSAIGHVVDSIGIDLGNAFIELEKLKYCRRCRQPIRDRFLCKIDRSSFHESCLRCTICDCMLREKCFEKAGDLYCEQHYYREWSSMRCARCLEGVSPSHLVYKLKSGIVYHVDCHSCYACGRLLSPGEQIVVDAATKQVSCLSHLTEKETSLLPSISVLTNDCINENELLGAPSNSSFSHLLTSPLNLSANLPSFLPFHHATILKITCDEKLLQEEIMPYLRLAALKGGQLPSPTTFLSSFDCSAFSDFGDDDNKFLRRRGPRTTIKQNQLDVLNRIFSTTPKPSKHARAKLALETGLSMRVIQVWFQNRRSKERRLKHLCNYLRHYEQRASAAAAAAAVAAQQSMEREGAGVPEGLELASQMGCIGGLAPPPPASSSAALFLEFDLAIPVFEEEEDEDELSN